MATLSRSDAAEIVRDAQDRLNEVIQDLQQVARSLGDGHAQAYMVDQLKTLASRDHGFLDSSFNLDDWIEELEQEDEPEAENEQD